MKEEITPAAGGSGIKELGHGGLNGQLWEMVANSFSTSRVEMMLGYYCGTHW